MSKNARRVTEAEALGEVDQTPADDLRRKYEQTAGPAMYIPESRFDDIRLEAYYDTAYPNSHVERQTLAAVDRAIAERVQRAAASHLEQAAHLLENEGAPKLIGPRELPNALAKVDAHLDELAAIRKELRAVRRQLDAQIEVLGTRLKLINILLMPLLVTFGALAYAWWRAQRRRGAQGGRP